MKLTLDLRKSVDENAAMYFEKVKKAKKKLEGDIRAIDETKRKIAQLIKEKDAELHKLDIELEQKQQKRKADWYEKFRWFFSSEGFLCVGGRDAATNDIVIKKHADTNDVVFHTDMAGSPFFVIKNEGKGDIGKITLQEAADATASFSRAWKLGMGTLGVFYVKPEQVTKTAKSGEYLTRGAFMISGKTTYIEPKMEVAVSLDSSGRIISGPHSAVEKNKTADAGIIMLRQGSKKPSDIAKTIKHKLKCDNDLDEIIRMIPAGNSDLI